MSAHLSRGSVHFIKFCMVGGVSTIINYSMFFGCYHYIGSHYLLSSAVGFCSGVIVGYVLNKIWTFKVDTQSVGQFFGYMGVYVLSLLVSLGTVIRIGRPLFV